MALLVPGQEWFVLWSLSSWVSWFVALGGEVLGLRALWVARMQHPESLRHHTVGAHSYFSNGEGSKASGLVCSPPQHVTLGCACLVLLSSLSLLGGLWAMAGSRNIPVA